MLVLSVGEKAFLARIMDVSVDESDVDDVVAGGWREHGSKGTNIV